MNENLKVLFVDNPYIAEQVCAFCNALPEFRETEQEFNAISEQIAEKLGQDQYFDFENAQSRYMAKLVNAYYLCGLGLRQEIISALQPKVS